MPKTDKLKMQLDTVNIHTVSQSLSIQYQLKHKQDIMHKLFKLVPT